MSTQSRRLPTGGRIDRDTVLTFSVDGVEYTGHPGDTVASALLANGQVRVGDSIYRGRPRGIVAAGVEEPNALLQIGGDCPEPMVPASTRALVDGLTASTLSGLGVLDATADEAIYDKSWSSAEVPRSSPRPCPPPGLGPAWCCSTSSPSSAARCCPAGRRRSMGGRRSTGSPGPPRRSLPRRRSPC